MSESKKSTRVRYRGTELYARDIERARQWLESYRTRRRLEELYEVEREMFGQGSVMRPDAEMSRRLYESRMTIEALDCGDEERLLLRMHAINGLSVAECAARLNVSRATAFRMRRRALLALAKELKGR